MKIGILTFHEADNCGAVLQAYALKETIQKIKDDAIVEIINYKMPYITRQYKLLSINTINFKVFTKSIISSAVHLKRKIISKPKYNSFRNNYLNISPTIYNKSEDIQGYDVYIVGSDQVWNPDITKKDQVFFLNFCKEGTKKISYAASIAKDKLDTSEVEFIKQNINNIDAISVRENSAHKLITSITDKQVTQVLDPTLIAEEEIWHSLTNNHDLTDKYILIYMVSINEEVLEIADNISKKIGLPVWCITTSYKTHKYGFKYIRDAGPIEFLRLIKGAEFIVTSSFHGTAFSIIFNKDFITVPYKKTSSRMTDLLSLLKLEDRIVENSNQIAGDYYLKINYTITNQILKNERCKSLEFLKEAIQGQKGELDESN